MNKTDIYGSSALHLATISERTEVVRVLLENQAAVSLQDRDGWSALHLATQNGFTEITNMLLDHHAQIDAQTKYGRTPLHCACASHNLATVETLLSRGASINIADSHGNNAIQSCRDPRVLQIMKIFAQDHKKALSASMDSIQWNNPENQLMSMQTLEV